MEEPTDSVVLRLTREQAQLLLEAVQEYSNDLVHHHQLPPVRGLRGRDVREAARRRWVAEHIEALKPLLKLLRPFGRRVRLLRQSAGRDAEADQHHDGPHDDEPHSRVLAKSTARPLRHRTAHLLLIGD